jgi:2-phosphosulfolactate phosphatase
MELFIRREISEIKSFYGTVIIIDVLRAVTSMCCLFSQGVKNIEIKANKEECLNHKKQHPEVLTLGEELGYQIDGFDLGNSPEQILSKNLKNHSIVMLTSNCTRGILAAENAAAIYCAGFVNIQAVAESLFEHSPEKILIVPMGNLNSRCPADDACAEYLYNYLTGKTIDFGRLKSLIEGSPEVEKFFDTTIQEFTTQDLMISLSLNKFPYALTVRKTDFKTEIEGVLKVDTRF